MNLWSEAVRREECEGERRNSHFGWKCTSLPWLFVSTSNWKDSGRKKNKAASWAFQTPRSARRGESRPAPLLLPPEWMWLSEAGGPSPRRSRDNWLDLSMTPPINIQPHYRTKQRRRNAAQLPALLSQRLTQRAASQLLREFKVGSTKKKKLVLTFWQL